MSTSKTNNGKKDYFHLESADGYTSVKDISRKYGVSYTTVTRTCEKLTIELAKARLPINGDRYRKRFIIVLSNIHMEKLEQYIEKYVLRRSAQHRGKHGGKGMSSPIVKNNVGKDDNTNNDDQKRRRANIATKVINNCIPDHISQKMTELDACHHFNQFLHNRMFAAMDSIISYKYLEQEYFKYGAHPAINSTYSFSHFLLRMGWDRAWSNQQSTKGRAMYKIDVQKSSGYLRCLAKDLSQNIQQHYTPQDHLNLDSSHVTQQQQ